MKKSTKQAVLSLVALQEKEQALREELEGIAARVAVKEKKLINDLGSGVFSICNKMVEIIYTEKSTRTTFSYKKIVDEIEMAMAEIIDKISIKLKSNKMALKAMSKIKKEITKKSEKIKLQNSKESTTNSKFKVKINDIEN